VTETRNVQLPADLCAALEANFSHKFGSIDELLVFVMRELLRDAASKADEAEQRLIEERLRELGYL
jgi:hypothetical protein